jgi:ParB/RepB/Spo0J family partition protein
MAKVKEVKYVKTNLLDIDPVYSREDYGDIEQLKNSIVENGVITPFVVYEVEQDDAVRYTIISGNRRKEAIRQLVEEEGYDDFSVPVIIDNKTDECKRIVHTIIDNDRKPLTALETATAYFRLSNKGWTAKKIAKRCGYSEMFIKDYLLLFSADEEMKAFIRDGKMAVAVALKKLKKDRDKDDD